MGSWVVTWWLQPDSGSSGAPPRISPDLDRLDQRLESGGIEAVIVGEEKFHGCDVKKAAAAFSGYLQGRGLPFLDQYIKRQGRHSCRNRRRGLPRGRGFHLPATDTRLAGGPPSAPKWLDSIWAEMLNRPVQPGRVAQMGERGVRNAEVEGSIPFSSTKPHPKKST